MRHRKVESGSADSGTAPSDAETLRVDINQMPRVLLRITRLALRHRGKMALAIACSIGSAAASLALPRLFGTAVDKAQVLLSGGNSPQATIHAALWTTAFLAITATFIRGILTMYAGYLGEYVSQQVAYDLRLRFFRQMQNLSFGFHDRVHSGDLITRGMLDLEGTRVFIQNGVLQTVSLLLLLGFAGVMMVSTDPSMAVIGLLFVPIAGLALARMGFLLRVAWLRIQELMANLTLIMEENLQGVRVVRAFAAKNFEMSKFDKASINTLNQAYKRIILRGRGLSAMTLSFYASMGALLWYGGHQVAVGAMTAGRVMEFLTYMSLMQTPIRQVAMIFNSAARATSAGSRLFEILDLQPEIADRPQAAQLVAGAGILRFDKVGFAYANAATALSDICFEVGPGQTLGIVGPAGSGKSTIASLVPRFYDVTEGSITIDGQDVRNVTLASLRQYVSLVPQEAFLFDNSIGHNVAYSDPWMPDERIVESAVTAQIHDHISTLPQTYETRVGERGLALSGGQRQRLTIARGVAPQPGVIIFDDSAAAIDSVTERRVRDALAGATRTKATIIIAHRLSSLMHADEIVVLEAGRIVERGTHEQLVAFGKTYAETFRMQSQAATLDAHQLTPGDDAV